MLKYSDLTEDQKKSICNGVNFKYWADSKTQSNNKRNSHILEYNGERKSLALFAEEYNLKFTTLKERLRRGWSVEKALLTKVKGIK